MRRSPSIVPRAASRDTYLVLDDFGGPLGRAWRETDEEDTDRETLIRDLMEGPSPDQQPRFDRGFCMRGSPEARSALVALAARR